MRKAIAQKKYFLLEHSERRRLTQISGPNFPMQSSVSGVGVPKGEGLLVDDFVLQARKLFPPGVGRSLYVMREVPIGMGRPDLMLMAVSSRGLSRFLESGLSLPTYSAARALVFGEEDLNIAVSQTHVRSLNKKLRELGWSDKAILSSNLVHDSVAIEAKLRDWRHAAWQVSKFKGFFQRSGILMPHTGVSERTVEMTTRRRMGLMALNSHNKSCELITPFDKKDIDTAKRLWLLEMLRRGITNGTAQRLSR